MPEPETDVIIIGGGPAGSATAAMLALSGARVRLIERERFPRYSVGESLIPFCYYDLEKIGVLDAVRRAGFVRKVSVQFIRPDGSDTHPFYFDQHLTGEAAVTWQVDRGKFDAILLDHARSCGVEIIEDCEVRKIEQSDSGSVIGVTALDPAGVERFLPARITVDASGRRGLAMHQMGWFIPDPQLRKVALWTYVRGAVRDPGRDEGATTVAYVGGKNWFWWIPLADDRVSVGIVGDADYLFANGKDLEAVFHRESRKSSWIRDHLAGATPAGPFRVTSDFSYRSRHIATDGLVLVGDAFAFLDPVFSSGLFLALKSGVMAAEAIAKGLEGGSVEAARFTEYAVKYCGALEAMRQLVHAFYDPEFSFGKVIRKYPEVRSDLTDCLIGNVDRDLSRLFRVLAEFASIPPALEFSHPLSLATVDPGASRGSTR